MDILESLRINAARKSELDADKKLLTMAAAEIDRLRILLREASLRLESNASAEPLQTKIFAALTDAQNEISGLRNDLAEVDGLLACHAHKLDSNPRDKWPKGSVLGRAVDRHNGTRAR